MLQTKKVADIWSALVQFVPTARSCSLAAILKKDQVIYIAWSDKVTPDVIVELGIYEQLLLIIEGKATKNFLSPDERSYLNDRIRESNAWLN